ncbi:hypothetical protein [Corynebacterium heidelbergense]|uniref:hypothetical protein n=1 Tax=Corynebacterium heidelbergense TaxID=2055947 RepID=UPI001874549D|nr:hypothetical protein [Corynebacterium heidelbergense]
MRQHYRTTASVALASVFALTSCTIPTDEGAPSAAKPSASAEPSPTVQGTSAPAQPPAPSPPAAPSGQENPALAAAVAKVTGKMGGTAGIAVSDGNGATYGGELLDGPAWSTSKVPLSIAALNAGGPGASGLVTRAIRSSDNAAADQLWQQLGSGQQAATQVGQVLQGVGDNTVVNAQVTRPGVSAYGQTQWKVTDQARFAAHLPCIQGAQPVLENMGQVESDQAYGLGNLPEARFKGGWGPDESGAYLVRQFGLVHGAQGDIAVAIAAKAPSGSYADGQAMLTALARELQQTQLDSLPAAHC